MLPLFESGIPLLLDRLRELPQDGPGITIAYPDEGAWKRFHGMFKTEGYPEVGCWCSRSFCCLLWQGVGAVGATVEQRGHKWHARHQQSCVQSRRWGVITNG